MKSSWLTTFAFLISQAALAQSLMPTHSLEPWPHTKPTNQTVTVTEYIYGPMYLDKLGRRSRDLKEKTALQLLRSVYDWEASIAKSVYVARTAKNAEGRATAFLVGGNLVLTAHHNFEFDLVENQNPDCGSFAIDLNGEWLACKKVHRCFFERGATDGMFREAWSHSVDFCLVEMESPGWFTNLDDLSQPIPLSRSIYEVKGEPILLIGNYNALGIQIAYGDNAESPIAGNKSRMELHHNILALRGASGGPILSIKGVGIGIHFFGNPEMGTNSPTILRLLKKHVHPEIFKQIHVVD